MSEKTVFISYRRDTVGNLFARLVEGALKRRGYDVFLDVDCIDAGEWAKQILTEVPKRAHFLLLLTPGALDRCTDETDWVRRELLLALERRRNIVPVREESVDQAAMRAAAPEAVKAIFDLQIHTIQHGSFENDIETLTTRYIPPNKAPKEGISKSTTFQADISRIIKYAPEELIGREAETKLLTDAWDQAARGEPKRPHVLTFVALGGEGKTSLVAKWAAELAHQDWPGCDAVFAWSFYSQGTREQTAVSSDAFLVAALTFFGDPAMAGSAQGAFDKGRRLAQLVGERRALLILDGVEPLQYAPTSPTPGELKDQGLAALLKGLAATSWGFASSPPGMPSPTCAPTGRPPRPMHELPRLSTAAGVKLLRTIGVKTGSQADFEKLVEDVDGHALTLQMLGSSCARLRRRHPPARPRQLEKADAEESRAATPSGRWRPM